MTSEEIRMLTKDELVAEYERTIKWYKEHNINRNFSKYAEMFWILFDDGANSYMWAIDMIPFAVGFLNATKKNWKRNWICIFNSN